MWRRRPRRRWRMATMLYSVRRRGRRRHSALRGLTFRHNGFAHNRKSKSVKPLRTLRNLCDLRVKFSKDGVHSLLKRKGFRFSLALLLACSVVRPMSTRNRKSKNRKSLPTTNYQLLIIPVQVLSVGNGADYERCACGAVAHSEDVPFSR